jgi:hypothetical protein
LSKGRHAALQTRKAPFKLVARTWSQSSSHQQAVLGDAGVIDHDVEALEAVQQAREQGVHLGPHRHIGPEAGAVTARGGGQLGRHGLGLGRVAAGDGHLGPRPQEVLGDGVADALGAAGDQRDFVLQIHLKSSSEF